MKGRVLIIEDEEEVGALIGMYLEKEGIKYTLCESGEDGMETAARERFDLVVLDINLPGMDGFEFLTKLRQQSGIPVVIVSAREADEDMILGLGIGADDFVTKPFSPRVLTARIRAHLRRGLEQRKGREHVVLFADFELDLDGYTAKKGGERIAIPPKEFELLRFLIQHAGEVLAVETLYNEVWGNKYGDLTTVAVHIQRLRKRFEEDPVNPKLIITVFSVGYTFEKSALRGAHET